MARGARAVAAAFMGDFHAMLERGIQYCIAGSAGNSNSYRQKSHGGGPRFHRLDCTREPCNLQGRRCGELPHFCPLRNGLINAAWAREELPAEFLGPDADMLGRRDLVVWEGRLQHKIDLQCRESLRRWVRFIPRSAQIS